MKFEDWYRTGQIRLAPSISDDSPEWPTTTVEIESCVDASTTTILERDTKEFISLGKITTSAVTMTLTDGRWKVASETDVEEVQVCPG